MPVVRVRHCCRGLLVAVVALGLGGCSADEAGVELAPWFVGEYVDPSHPDGALRLSIDSDGTFVLAQRAEWEDRDDEREILATGRWISEGDGLTLDAAEWSAVLVSDEISVTLLSRSDTISGLRCAETTGSALLDSVRLMRYRDFADFVNPPEGSGSSTGGL